MKKHLSNEEIRDRILSKNNNINIINIKRERRNSKTRILVKIKCECGIEFERDLTHLTHEHSSCLCGHCSQKLAHDNRKKRYNKKYERMLERFNITPLEKIENWYARDKIEVEENDTKFRFLWNVGEKPKRPLIFQPNGENYKNFKYNLLRHSEINGYTCSNILTKENDTNINVTCECGNIYSCNYSKFLNGQFRCNSCSTTMSKYEKIFEQFLKENNIEYIYQYRISSCKYKKPLPFDFLLCKQRILVEIQGEQHYFPIKFRCHTQEEAESLFEKQKIRDNIKLEFCKEKNIPLLILSYKDILSNEFNPKTKKFIQTHTN